MKKILIIRFSSFGDIVQALSVTKLVKEKYPDASLDWLTKKEFGDLVSLSPYVDSTVTLNKKDGVKGLVKLSLELRAKNYDLVYDAHSNLRSFIIKLLLGLFKLNSLILTRSKERLNRILLFKFKKNKFPKPYRGMISYCEPLGLSNSTNLIQSWKFKEETIIQVEKQVPHLNENFVVLAPSAAWEMKRWPVEHWKKLIQELKGYKLYLVGGPDDTFIEAICKGSDDNVTNLTGKLNLIESSYLVARSKLVISADTGIIHVADILGVNGLSLMGPTAFGFSTNKNIQTLEVELPCRPCSKDGRGGCERSLYQECMVSISVNDVKLKALEVLKG
jgi:ADP-heptose:LPS heptosyltransferase